MNRLNPDTVIARLAKDVPATLLADVYLIGSLAAACHYPGKIESRAVNTKDADLVVQPIGNVQAVIEIASSLRGMNWRWKLDFAKGGDATTPEDSLPDVRLYPPGRSPRYWIELQGLPEVEQVERVRRTRVVIEGEHYSVPCFRFAGITAQRLRNTSAGFRYADPAMMALSNLLGHTEVGLHRMSTPIEGKRILRSAKDLGRVLAFARLSDRWEVQGWLEPWTQVLRACFPRSWRSLGAHTGAGLRALLADEKAMTDAHWSTTYGLLRGVTVSREELLVVGEGFLADLVEPFEKRCRQ